MVYKYGTYSPSQIGAVKERMRKQIYFLLLCVDKKTKDQYQNVDVEHAIINTQNKFSGLNELLLFPPELVDIMGSLESALVEYKNQTSISSVIENVFLTLEQKY